MVATTTGLPSGAALASAKKAAAAKAAALKKPRAKPSHPRTSDMVDAAIVALKEKGGSSLQAIKKYVSATYKVDAEKLSPFIKKYLKSAVVGKKLVQTKGKGASGSFKLSLGDAAAKTKKTVAKKKPAAAKKPATPAKKKVVATKKAASPKKKSVKTLAAKPPKPKVSKAKPAAKKPAAKPARKPASKAKKTSARKPVARK